jgi:hypothetical protein
MIDAITLRAAVLTLSVVASAAISGFVAYKVGVVKTRATYEIQVTKLRNENAALMLDAAKHDGDIRAMVATTQGAEKARDMAERISADTLARNAKLTRQAKEVKPISCTEMVTELWGMSK